MVRSLSAILLVYLFFSVLDLTLYSGCFFDAQVAISWLSLIGVGMEDCESSGDDT